MEILYVWIKKYKNIEKQGFNFSPKWRFNYDPETGKLDVEDRQDKVIDNFFGEHISNVTAIVGENGSGKSGILEFILDVLFSFKGDYNLVLITDRTIFIPKDWPFTIDEKWDFKSLFDENTFQTKRFNPIHDKTPIYGKWEYKAKETQLVYFSNFLSRKNESNFKIEYHKDVSTDFFIENDLKEYGYGLTPDALLDKIDILRFEDTKRQLKLVIDFYNDLQFDFIPTEISIQINNVDYNILASRIKSLSSLYEKHCGDDTFYSNNNIQSFIRNLCVGIFLNRFRLIFSFSKDVGKSLNDFAAFQGSTFENKLYNYLVKVISESKGFMKLSDDLIQDVVNWVDLIKEWNEKGNLQFSNGAAKVKLTLDNFTFLEKFLSFYQKVIAQTGFLKISWNNLSTGEMGLLNLFSRIYSVAIKMTQSSGKNNCIILLDEGELGFHPRWQKQHLFRLVNLIPKLFSNSTKKLRIHIILTSNSPFILSDLPKENVIFLKKDESGKCQVVDGLNDMKQTFGANIHTLLSDGFFMDGLMGDFAKGKIDKVIRYLNRELNPGETMTEEEAGKIIDMIGEPILKRHLQQQFNIAKMTNETSK
ncbi:MAG: AAA family ATPase [Saprospiraceae bacterium]|nr:AAA family ATPase [Saprospiraceae bacterium]